MSKCFKCGTELTGSGKFCPECGASQERAVPQYGERLTGISLSGESFAFSLNISPGETLFGNRFIIESRIGSGGFGEVYLALDQDANHPVALKIVPTVDGGEETAAEQLRNEINLRRSINNFEYIIRVNDIYVDSNYKGLPLVLLSMEYANGGSLRGWIRENIDSIKQDSKRSEALRYFRDACLGVKAIHDAGLIHLDLKPENLLIMDNKVKVSDLGLSRNYIHYARNQEMILKEYGTPSYMSPEQFKSARQKDINRLSDIYTLGIILFEILDGQVPFDGDYDELKEKHLTFTPPSLGDAFTPWGRIADRCLAKEPAKRYPSVDDVIPDLMRAETGDVLSVDVACKCGHINASKDLKKCQKCGEDISHLFRRCPNCRRLNRLDVEICPDCDFKVGRHFRVLDLLTDANKWRHMNPEEAIRCLVEVLKLEGGNREAKEMLPGLREIQEKIDAIVPEAERAQESGRLEDARGKWQDILSLAPRHLLATEKKQGLDQMIERYNTNYDRAFVLMDQGKFSRARELLNECRGLVPTRKETYGALKDLNEREKPYSQHFEKAKSETRVKNLGSARKEVDLCLAEAPKSEEGLRLKTKIDKDMGKAARLFSDAKNLLKAAEFDAVQRDIEQIQELQKDLSGFKGFTAEKKEKEKRYHHLSSKWKTALESEIRDLSRAEANLKEVLKIFPECIEATKLLDQVVVDKDRAIQLIENAKLSIRAAEFTKAKNEITKAKGIWPKVPELITIGEKLVVTHRIYNNHINEGTELYEKKKDLDPALEQITASLKICPDSSEAKDLANKITKDQGKANRLIEEANSFLRAADFDKAQNRVKQAGLIWPKVPELTRTEKNLDITRKSYNNHINVARALCSERYGKKGLDLASLKSKSEDALAECNKAIELCPGSREARDLKKEIASLLKKTSSLIKMAAERRKKRKKIIFITLIILMVCTVLLVAGFKIVRHFDLDVLKLYYFSIVLLFSLLAHILFSAFAPVVNGKGGAYTAFGLWIMFGAVIIISCLVFRYIFHKTWMTGASVGLTISGIYIVVIILRFLAKELKT